MHENRLKSKIRKIATAKLLLALPLLVGAALLAWAMAANGILMPDGYLQPYDVQFSFAKIDSIARHPMARETFRIVLNATVDDIVDTGVQHTVDDQPVGEYFAVFVEQKYILCYVSESRYDDICNGGSCVFTGVLKEAEPDAVALVINDMTENGLTGEEASDALYAYTIDTTESGAVPRTFLYIALLLLAASGLYIAARSLLALVDTGNYPPVKKLAKYGEKGMLLEEIEQEYAEAGSDSYPLGRGRNSVCLTKNWIVAQGPLFVKFMRSESLLWAYKQKQTTKYYGVITAGVVFFVKLMGRDTALSLAGDEFSVDKLLGAIAEGLPGAAVGYSARLEALWRSGREQFEAQVRGSGSQAGGIEAIGQDDKDKA
jgi:hypothetical protein